MAHRHNNVSTLLPEQQEPSRRDEEEEPPKPRWEPRDPTRRSLEYVKRQSFHLGIDLQEYFDVSSAKENCPSESHVCEICGLSFVSLNKLSLHKNYSEVHAEAVQRRAQLEVKKDQQRLSDLTNKHKATLLPALLDKNSNQEGSDEEANDDMKLVEKFAFGRYFWSGASNRRPSHARRPSSSSAPKPWRRASIREIDVAVGVGAAAARGPRGPRPTTLHRKASSSSSAASTISSRSLSSHVSNFSMSTIASRLRSLRPTGHAAAAAAAARGRTLSTTGSVLLEEELLQEPTVSEQAPQGQTAEEEKEGQEAHADARCPPLICEVSKLFWRFRLHVVLRFFMDEELLVVLPWLPRTNQSLDRVVLSRSKVEEVARRLFAALDEKAEARQREEEEERRRQEQEHNSNLLKEGGSAQHQRRATAPASLAPAPSPRGPGGNNSMAGAALVRGSQRFFSHARRVSAPARTAMTQPTTSSTSRQTTGAHGIPTSTRASPPTTVVEEAAAPEPEAVQAAADISNVAESMAPGFDGHVSRLVNEFLVPRLELQEDASSGERFLVPIAFAYDDFGDALEPIFVPNHSLRLAMPATSTAWCSLEEYSRVQQDLGQSLEDVQELSKVADEKLRAVREVMEALAREREGASNTAAADSASTKADGRLEEEDDDDEEEDGLRRPSPPAAAPPAVSSVPSRPPTRAGTIKAKATSALARFRRQPRKANSSLSPSSSPSPS